MSLESAFAPAEARYKAQVMHATWGHLAVEPGSPPVRAAFVFAIAGYGGSIDIITADIDAPDSPWLAEAMLDFACRNRFDGGRVYRFEGTYRMTKNGRGVFKGRTRVVPLKWRTP